MRASVASVSLVLALVGFGARQVAAAPITYQFSGTGSGAIGGTSFADAAVLFTGTADTDNVVPLSFMGASFYVVALDSLTVNIAGVGTAAVTEPSEVFAIPQAVVDPEGEIPPLPGVILGRMDNPPDVSGGFTGMAAVFTNALAGYDLTTPLGGVTGAGGVGFIEDCGTPFHDPCLATSLGPLSFTTNIMPEATGTLTARTEDVPEPVTLLLMSGGLVAWAGRSRRRSDRR